MSSVLSSYFKTVILASASPARLKILERESLRVIVRPTDTDEILDNVNSENIRDKLINLSLDKLNTYIDKYGESEFPIITCDTVIYFNNNIIGKAKNREEAQKTLLSFSGKKQRVYTAMCLKLPDGRLIKTCDMAELYFKNNSKEEIEKYLNTDEWIGAAGSYRIQAKGYSLIDRYFGDFDTIVGLPLLSISDLLRATLS